MGDVGWDLRPLQGVLRGRGLCLGSSPACALRRVHTQVALGSMSVWWGMWPWGVRRSVCVGSSPACALGRAHRWPWLHLQLPAPGDIGEVGWVWSQPSHSSPPPGWLKKQGFDNLQQGEVSPGTGSWSQLSPRSPGPHWQTWNRDQGSASTRRGGLSPAPARQRCPDLRPGR